MDDDTKAALQDPRPVTLSGRLRTAILDHVRRELPREACGLLLGTPSSIVDIFPARNELRSATRYRIDPRDHFAAIRAARAAGLAVVGAFHSHPRSAPSPSETDRAEAWPAFIYVIATPDPGHAACPLRAWSLVSGNFVEHPLVTPAEEDHDRPCLYEGYSPPPS
jgi:proteasome lid subunit RPN8/RPN11